MTNKTKSGASKLDYDKAMTIKLLCTTTNLSDTEIADIYGVSRVLVNHIRHQRRWDDIPLHQVGESVSNPLKTIYDVMKTYQLDSLEYRDMKILINNSPNNMN